MTTPIHLLSDLLVYTTYKILIKEHRLKGSSCLCDAGRRNFKISIIIYNK